LLCNAVRISSPRYSDAGDETGFLFIAVYNYLSTSADKQQKGIGIANLQQVSRIKIPTSGETI